VTANLKTGPDEYAAPTTIEETVKLLADGDGRILAGGTDLMIQTREGRTPYRKKLVNVRRVEDMHGVSRDGNTIRIGALTTMTDILNNTFLKEMAPVLCQTADQFASGQIRNAATIGGNLCNASPAGDTIPPLLVLDAEVELRSWDGASVTCRNVPLKDFFTAPGKTVIQDNELLTSICLEIPEQRSHARFLKSGPRPALEISIVSMAMNAINDAGTLFHVRLALGAVAPTPVRAYKTEKFLELKTITPDLIDEAVDILMEEIDPIDDVRATAWYRRHLASVYLRRLLGDDG